jgi:hypothetical protein
MYHQTPGANPIVAETRFSKATATDEQPFGPRRLTIGRVWTHLELGWVNPASMVSIKNVTGDDLAAYPTKEEKEAIAEAILELALEPLEDKTRTMHSPPKQQPEGAWVILPGESFRGTPKHSKRILIRSLGGDAEAVITAFPV